MATPPRRVLILGLDGATWTVLDPMMERGAMPNLKALLRKSAYGVLQSTLPPVTTAAWTTMMTGCEPARHGVFDHRYFDAAAERMKVNHSGRCRVPTFWHSLSRAGRSVACLNVPGTFPPLDVRGLCVSGMDAPNLEAATSGCPEFARVLRAKAPDYSLRYFWKRPPETLNELVENAALTAASFRGRALGGVLADESVPDWSALMVQFQNLDPFQHRAWRALDVDETGIHDDRWSSAAAEVLRGLDDAIGILCELAERRGAAVLACSDHGFGPCHGRIHVNRILIDAGIAKLPGTRGKLMQRMRRGAEKLSLWTARHQTPDSRRSSYDQSVTAQWPLDWKRTLAFAPHQDTAAMVYLNSVDRRANAPLRTARQIDDARNGAAVALATARHHETGKPLFTQVICVAEEYGVDPAQVGYPDLIALPDEPYWVRTKLASGRRWVEPDPLLPGTHRPEGVIALAGAGLDLGKTLRANLRDVAPTILSLLGEPIPEYMEGGVIGTPETREITAHKAHGVAYSGPHTAQGFEYSAEEQALIEQRLSDLGYLE